MTGYIALVLSVANFVIFLWVMGKIMRFDSSHESIKFEASLLREEFYSLLKKLHDLDNRYQKKPKNLDGFIVEVKND